jgi:DNA-binding transcriptional ArsR family regulator
VWSFADGAEEGEMDLAKLQASAKSASTLLKALANEHRLLILCRLVDQERSVGELVRAVGLSQSALSQHLARLRRDGIVRTRREAQTIWYTIASPEAREVLATLYELYCAQPAPAERSATAEEGKVRAEVCA